MIEPAPNPPPPSASAERGRRELARNRRWPRRLRPYREGVWLIVMVLGLGVAAVNTGHNLLYLILGFLLSIILLSGFLSERMLRHTRVELEPEVGYHAGEAARVTVWLLNPRRRGRIYSVRTAPVLGAEVGETVPAYFAEVPARGFRRGNLRIRFNQRGVHRVEALRTETDFPFSLFTKSRILPCDATFRVWPRVHPIVFPPPDPVRRESLRRSPRVAAWGEELFGVREYRPGDPPNRIHWRLSARVGRPVVREFELPRTPELRIDCRIPALGHPAEEDRYAETAASLAMAALEAGYAVGLRTSRALLPPDRGGGQRRRILDLLSEEPAFGPVAQAGVKVVPLDERGRPLPTPPHLSALLPGFHRAEPPRDGAEAGGTRPAP